MPGESQQTPSSIPDPSVLATDALVRAIAAERDYVDGQLEVLRERLRGIDVATRLLNDSVTRVPTDVTESVSHLRELMEEKFSSIATQFKERDTRSERESRDNKTAVDAAFAAQKEASAEQNKSNTLAISKSEGATTETINKLGELVKTTTDGLADKIEGLKERVDRSESSRAGSRERVTDQRQSLAAVYGFAGFVVALLTLAGILAAAGVFQK